MEKIKIIRFVDDFTKSHFDEQNSISNDLIIEIQKNFLKELKAVSDIDFQKILLSVYIPEHCSPDSSFEKVFTKLIEVLVYEWALRMGLRAEIITQKSGVEDVRVFFNDQVILIDAKTFRLSRSQKAPNVKDFLKLESVEHWFANARLESLTPLGGLVVYTSLHEWKRKSDVYKQTTSHKLPTLMLPFKYLGFLLHYKDSFVINNLTNLWDYQRLFPQQTDQKEDYWKVINAEISRITGKNATEISEYMELADDFIEDIVNDGLTYLENYREFIISSASLEVQNMSLDDLIKMYIDFKISSETEALDKNIDNIKNFRKRE